MDEVTHVVVYPKNFPLIDIARNAFNHKLAITNCRHDADRVIHLNVGQIVLVNVTHEELHEELHAALAVAQGRDELVLIEVPQCPK